MPRPDALAAIERDRDVQRDAVHPGGKAHALVKDAERSPELDDNFLRQIVPVARVPAIGIADLVEDLLVLLHQVLEPILKRRRRHYPIIRGRAGKITPDVNGATISGTPARLRRPRVSSEKAALAGSEDCRCVRSPWSAA